VVGFQMKISAIDRPDKFRSGALRGGVFELNADLDDSELPFRVDVVVWQELPESMRAAIGRDLAPVV
jgi:hypothetical protein